MKNRKHWLSFASSFFIPLDKVISDIEISGKVFMDNVLQSFKNERDLVCPKCGAKFRFFPEMKDHYMLCQRKRKFLD